MLARWACQARLSACSVKQLMRHRQRQACGRMCTACAKSWQSQKWWAQAARLTWHSSTASFMRTVMYSSPISSGMPAFSSRCMTWREGLLITGWMPRFLCELIQSCTSMQTSYQNNSPHIIRSGGGRHQHVHLQAVRRVLIKTREQHTPFCVLNELSLGKPAIHFTF